VDTGFRSVILADDDGIEATQALAGGNIEIITGEQSWIVAGDDGINASSYASFGAIDVTTGTQSVIFAANDGIVADKLIGGLGDVSVQIGTQSFIGAGDDAITAINYAIGPGNNIAVTTGEFSVALANDKGVRAGGWDRVMVNTGASSVLVGDFDQDGVGNAIRIFDADVAVANVGTDSFVIGSGKSWGEAVVSIESDDVTFINIGEGAPASRPEAGPFCF
jgi:hypothetical protein